MTRVKYEKEKVRLLPFLIIGLLLFVLYSCFVELYKTPENIIGNIVVISIGIIGIVLTIIWTIKINRERKNFIKNNLKIKEHGEKIVTDSIIVNHKLVEMSDKYIRRYFFEIKYNYNGEKKQYESPIITIMNDKEIIKPINKFLKRKNFLII